MRITNEIRRLKKATTIYIIISLLIAGVNFAIVAISLWKIDDFIMQLGIRVIALNILFLIVNAIYYLKYYRYCVIKINQFSKMIIATNIIATIGYVVLFMLDCNRKSLLIYCTGTCWYSEICTIMHVLFDTSDLYTNSYL